MDDIIYNATTVVLMENKIYDRCKLKRWLGSDGYNRLCWLVFEKMLGKSRFDVCKCRRTWGFVHTFNKRGFCEHICDMLPVVKNMKHWVPNDGKWYPMRIYLCIIDECQRRLPGYVNFVGPSIQEMLEKKKAEKSEKDNVRRNEMWRKFQQEIDADLEGHLNTQEMYNFIKKYSNLLMDRNCSKK